MERPFDFDDATKDQARFRQFGRCAVCGRSMNSLYEHAHHVVPNQSGNPANSAHAWLRSAENCVVLCDVCHYAIHESGRYRQGGVAPPSYFTHSHGKDRVAHQAWVDGLEHRMELLWGPAKTSV
jgi:hypothetical protein